MPLMIFTLGLLIVIGGLTTNFFTPVPWFVILAGGLLMAVAWLVAGLHILKGHIR